MYKVVVALAVSLAGLSAQAQLWNGVIAPGRAVDWSNVGVPGGIPNRTTVCATLSPGASAAQINSAIAACPSGQVVSLNAGTYNLSAGVDFNGKNNVTLRGAGADQTFLVFSGGGAYCHNHNADVCIDQPSTETNWQGGPSNTATWTASSYATGQTQLTFSSTRNLKVGQPVILDQADDGADTGGVFVCSDNTISPPCSLEDNVNNSQRTHRNQAQVVTVTACGTASSFGQACNGANVTISPGLYMGNWSAAKSPGAWWATTAIYNSGVENVSLDHTNSSGARGVEIYNCLGCWVKGVRSIDSGKAHIEVSYSAKVTVRDNYLYLTQNAVTQSYGVESFNTSDTLVENNILQYIAGPLMINSDCSGCVLGYNFTVNDYYTASAGYISASTNNHGGGQDMYLYEGNSGAVFYGDVFHGTHNLITVFRNYWSGNQLACSNGGSGFQSCTSNKIPFDIRSYSRFYNIIGNVLGTPGAQSAYELYAGGPSSGTGVFELGFGNTENGVTVPNDALVRSTMMRWGNWDAVTGTTRFVASEVPSGISTLPNPVPASQSLPASFYLNAKPAWWPAAKPWPPMGPDVSGGNIANTGGHAYTNPAQDCYLNVMGGPANGTGPALSFNANTCYAAATAPAPPTGLTTTVH